MPYIPRNSAKRPWITPRKPFEGRVQSSFYYTAIWKRTRLAYLMAHPLCAHCLTSGTNTPATDIDHIIPINPHNAWDFDGKKYGNPVDSGNLQSLCKSCHSKKTGKERGVEYR